MPPTRGAVQLRCRSSEQWQLLLQAGTGRPTARPRPVKAREVRCAAPGRVRRERKAMFGDDRLTELTDSPAPVVTPEGCFPAEAGSIQQLTSPPRRARRRSRSSGAGSRSPARPAHRRAPSARCSQSRCSVYVVALAVSNTHDVRVDWVFGSASLPLVWLVLAAIGLGSLLGLSLSALLRLALPAQALQERNGIPTTGRAADLEETKAEARYHRERYDLYKAKDTRARARLVPARMRETRAPEASERLTAAPGRAGERSARRALRTLSSTTAVRPGARQSREPAGTRMRSGTAACSGPRHPRARGDHGCRAWWPSPPSSRAHPECERTEAMIAPESLPSARITERSTAAPPEGCGRARRLTTVRIASSSIVFTWTFFMSSVSAPAPSCAASSA